MQHSYPIKVKEVRRETVDCVSVSFDIPENLRTEFQFKPGQYLNIIKTIHGEEFHRSYSLCVSPLSMEYRVAIKKVEGGKFSTFANDHLKAGDTLELMPPNGKFTRPILANQSKHYLLIAAGSGITPILSLLSTILEVESQSSVCLIYGNTTIDHIIFRNQLLDLKNIYHERLQLNFVLSREWVEEECFQGRIDGHKLLQYNGKIFHATDLDEVFLCGPESMILDCKSTLLSLGIPESNIHFELFGTEIKKSHKVVELKTNAEFSKIRLKTDGRTTEFDLAFNTQSILDAALAKKVNLPYACKGGVCCTCKAKLVEGEVEMAKVYGLEKDEIEAGYILTCQSYPKTSKIMVDFDQ
ncbi:MAG: phenylacetate-CoA oxygenase/reductase subunit PaaK [Saprospiraceae bacterium]|nr:phenylacetate-CoA oxygenase/reductase subunit PaaK [Saprospiraceae bacterium]